MASIYIWGFQGGEQTLDLAIQRGVAFQLTNILRDLREDFSRDRLYLPQEDLTAAGVSEGEVRSARGGAGFERLVRLQVERAESYYESSVSLESRIEEDSRATLSTMTAIYRSLLRKIAKNPSRVLRERVSLSLIEKLKIAGRAVRGG